MRKRTIYMTYNSTLPKVFVYLLTTIETLYQTRVPLEVQNRKNFHLATSDCLVIACYLLDVRRFSETLKAKHEVARSGTGAKFSKKSNFG